MHALMRQDGPENSPSEADPAEGSSARACILRDFLHQTSRLDDELRFQRHFLNMEDCIINVN